MSSDKPRICEVLGVEVGERFKVVDYKFAYDSAWLEVAQDGYIAVAPDTPDEQKSHSAAILAIHAINHPESIIRKPRFTEDEVATMRVLYAAGVRYVERKENNTLLWAMSEKDKGGNRTLYSGHVILCGDFPSALFSSILAGRSVTIADIIKNEKES